LRLGRVGVAFDGAAFGSMGFAVGVTSAVHCGVATRAFIGHHGSWQRCALHSICAGAEVQVGSGLARMRRALCAP
jgi:hypothetical protein